MMVRKRKTNKWPKRTSF